MDRCRAVGLSLLAPLLLLAGCSSGLGGYVASAAVPPRISPAPSTSKAPMAVASRSAVLPVASGATRYLEVDNGESVSR